MKKFLLLVVLVLGGVWTYFWYVRDVNLFVPHPAPSPLPAYSATITAPAKDANGAITRWQLAAPMPTPRLGVGAAELGGKIYVIGGMDSLAKTVATAETFDVATNRWTEIAPLPRAASFPIVGSDGSKLYVFGGFEGYGMTAVDRTYVFDPKTGVWKAGKDMPTPLGAAAIATVKGQFHLIGGQGLGHSTQAQTVYDPATDRWYPDEPITSGRDNLAAAAIGDKIYAAGGSAGSLVYSTAALEIYDMGSKTWEQGQNMPAKRSSVGAAAINGTLYVFGGEAPSVTLGDVYAYDPKSDRWKVADLMPTPRHGFGYALSGGRVFIVGGGRRPGFSVSDVMEVFTP